LFLKPHLKRCGCLFKKISEGRQLQFGVDEIRILTNFWQIIFETTS